ncbi:MAG: NUDIX domain-containing protein [Ferruginibacter sp.]
MSKKSAGIILFRTIAEELKVLLVHPGGPFYLKKDIGCWSIPKGEFTDSENAMNAAIRELQEETGIIISGETLIELTPIHQKSGKIVFAWALNKDIDAEQIVSNTFEIEWPPKSGILKTFAEIDKAAWFNLKDARQKILPAQISLLTELEAILLN